MKILLFSILAVAMIGLMVPSALAVYPDPDKDPKEYLIRYYTEPTYKEWFDTNYPNTTIEEKVGYPNKIITDDYYTDSFAGFVVLYPPEPYVFDTIAQSSQQDVYGLFSVAFGGDDDWHSLYIVYYLQSLEDDIPPRELNQDEIDATLSFWNFLPTNSISEDEGVSVQLKINDQTYAYKYDRHVIRYDFTTSSYYDENYWNAEKIGWQFVDKHSFVQLMYPNGDIFQFIFTASAETYSKDVEEFDKIINSFYIGKTEKFSDMYEDYLGTQKSEPEPTTPTSEPTAIEPEPTAIEPKAAPEPAVMEAESEPEPVTASESDMCGAGTTYKNGKCVLDEKGGGCLIATAAFGSEMAPQVQFLRELRDNTVLQTQAGTTFMTGFNQFYYSFSPVVADYERENPVFKEAVKVGLTPLLTSLTLLNYVDIDTEQEMLGYGIGVILLNIGMYFVAPAVVIISLKKRFKF